MLRLAAWPIAIALCLGATEARAQPAPDVVLVHLDAPTGTALRGRANAQGHWSVVCMAPCDRSLDTTWLYSVAGSGSVPLSGAPPGAWARVVVTPPPSLTLGHAVIVAGGITYVAGEGLTVAWIVGLILHATGQTQQPWVTPLGYAGTAVALSGVVILVAGALYNAATRDAGHIDLTWQSAPTAPPPLVGAAERSSTPGLEPRLVAPIWTAAF